MSKYYSTSPSGFYDTAIHGDQIPTDAVKITDAYHAELLAAQSTGKVITADEHGYPIAIYPPQQIRTRESLLAEVAAKRWTVETGGILVAGHPIATDRESQAQVSSAYASLKGGLVTDTPWKAMDGSFTLFTLAEIEPVAQAITAHVRACFAAERAHSEAISAMMTQDELDAYSIEEGWPE